jgi:hypothetical protein
MRLLPVLFLLSKFFKSLSNSCFGLSLEFMFAGFLIVDTALLVKLDFMPDTLNDVLELFVSIVLDTFDICLTLPFKLLKLFCLLALVENSLFIFLAYKFFNLVR